MYAHIGRQLKEAREQQGISLQTVHEKTKVSLRYLEAIESGAVDVMPGEFYLKGFIRSYARVVGLNPEELLATSECRPHVCEETVTDSSQGLLARLAHNLRHNFFGGSHRVS